MFPKIQWNFVFMNASFNLVNIWGLLVRLEFIVTLYLRRLKKICIFFYNVFYVLRVRYRVQFTLIRLYLFRKFVLNLQTKQSPANVRLNIYYKLIQNSLKNSIIWKVYRVSKIRFSHKRAEKHDNFLAKKIVPDYLSLLPKLLFVTF